MADRAAPTNEIGAGAGLGTMTWRSFMDDSERVPELRWPRSVKEFDRMRNHSQVQALYSAHTLPIRRFDWQLDANGADAGIVKRISEDIGVPVKGSTETVDNTASNFNHEDCLRHALLALIYGHMYGEISGEIVDGWWRLRKVAPRMPLTIAKIEVADDGGLAGIRQNITRKNAVPANGMIGGAAPLIPVDRLVAWVWEREGANWAGRSMLRPLYGNYLIQQRLMRVDATKHERNGMGVPIAKATVAEVGRRALQMAAKMATKLRAGQNSGGALPYGMDIDLKGVQGNLPDTLASIKYHDEAMARGLLAMFLQLGQTETGSRALGGEFIDFFALALDAIATWYANVFTNYVLRKWVMWNVGESSPTPKLTFTSLPPELAAADLVALIEKGAIHMDEDTEAWVRGRYRIPQATTPRPIVPTASTTPPAPATGATEPHSHSHAAAADNSDSPIPLPSRDLRRQPYEFEVTAAVDFAQLDAQFEDSVSKLLTGWAGVKTAHINELVDIIAQTDPADLEALSAIAAESGGGSDLLTEVMHEVAEKGAEGAVAEAKAQGVTDATVPDLTDLKGNLTTRAVAVDVLLTRSISEAAARKATSLAGGALGKDAIANEVKTYLNGLSDSYLEEQFTGVVSQAQNSGRRAVLVQEEPASVYASELLDKNTCSNCRGVDGNEYESVAAAEEDYPSGGYKDCLGGPKCRGTLVGIYDEAS